MLSRRSPPVYRLRGLIGGALSVLVHAQWGVGTILGLPSVPRSLSPILLSPFEFPPSSQRTWGGTGNKEGEVSDPPYFVPRTSRQARPCNTPCNTLLPCGGGRSLLIDPCGKAAVKTPEETLRFDAWTVPLWPRSRRRLTETGNGHGVWSSESFGRGQLLRLDRRRAIPPL